MLGSGKTELILYPLLFLSVVAAATDLFRGKIYNWLTLPGVVCGLIAAFALGGLPALGNSALAVGLALVLYGWMFGIGVLGGGDVKLLMAFGAWGGTAYTADVALLGILLGGVFGVFHLVVRGRAVAFARKIYQVVLSLLVRELALQAPAVDRQLKMPFGIPMAVAAIWVALANPFDSWGLSPW
jgi:prepilin peptidase CpaA